MSKLIVTPLAKCDIEAIGDYIAQDNPWRAVNFVRELFAQCKTIAGNPLGTVSVLSWRRTSARAPIVTT
ncbi:type II toxin-antitoxin system RelE/ParE family toxin [Methylomonas sp. LWB]|uniref:type II toxin-antitoxin system RelE/ParE family toxin n=1 Tax=Methylomonas sp. LWB TaxID=1905845 RepID=UPI000A6C8005